MKQLFWILACLNLVWSAPLKDTLLYTEGFENAVQGSFSPQTFLSGQSFWTVATRTQTAGKYTGAMALLDACPFGRTGLNGGEGSQFLAAQRANAVFSSAKLAVQKWDTLVVQVKLSACDQYARFDSADSLAVELSPKVKLGYTALPTQNLLVFKGVGNSFDGTGSNLKNAQWGDLGASFKNYEMRIPVTMSLDSVALWVRTAVNAGSEEVAIDDIRIRGIQNGAPFMVKDLPSPVLYDKSDSLQLNLFEYFKDEGGSDSSLKYTLTPLGDFKGVLTLEQGRVLKYSPQIYQTGTYAVQIQATDKTGLSFFDTLNIQVQLKVYPQNITWTIPQTVRYAQSVAILAQSNAAIQSNITSLTESICSVVDSTLTAKKVGDCVLKAKNSGDARDWDSASSEVIISIQPKILNVSAHAQNKVYGNPDPNLTYSTDSLVTGDTLLGNLSRSTGENVGAYSIQSQLNHPNYQINFTPDSLKITPKSIDVYAIQSSKVYGSEDSNLTYMAFGLVNNDELLGTLARDLGENVGKYAILQGTLGHPNYTINWFVDSLSIIPKDLFILPDSATKLYGTENPTFTFTVSGLAFNDKEDVLITQPELSSVAHAMSDVGYYPIVASGGQALNYNLVYLQDSLYVAPRTVTVTPFTPFKTYGEADPEFTYLYDGFLFNETFTGALGRVAGENVGKYALSVGSLKSPNYVVNLVSDSLEILPKSATITANGASKTYGEADPKLTYTTSGLIDGDSLTGSLTREEGENVNTYQIQQGNLNNPNYSLSYVGNLFEIQAKTLQIVAQAQAKNVGETDPVLAYDVVGSLVGEDQISGTLSREEGETPGVYQIQLGNLSAGSNYILDFVSDTFTIADAVYTYKTQPKSFVSGTYRVIWQNYLGQILFDQNIHINGSLKQQLNQISQSGRYVVTVIDTSGKRQQFSLIIP